MSSQIFKHSKQFGPITKRDQELITEFLIFTTHLTNLAYTPYEIATRITIGSIEECDMFKDWAKMQD
jgi:hypothetical protein